MCGAVWVGSLQLLSFTLTHFQGVNIMHLTGPSLTLYRQSRRRQKDLLGETNLWRSCGLLPSPLSYPSTLYFGPSRRQGTGEESVLYPQWKMKSAHIRWLLHLATPSGSSSTPEATQLKSKNDTGFRRSPRLLRFNERTHTRLGPDSLNRLPLNF